MKKEKTKKVRVAVDAKWVGDSYEVEFNDLQIPLDGVKRYHHTLFKLFGLTTCERIFLDYLTEIMRIDNSVYINEDEVLRFINVIGKGTGMTYQRGTVWNAFKSLRANNFLLKTKKSSGLYHINPIFFSKSGEKVRTNSIKVVFDFNGKDSKQVKESKIRIYKDMVNMYSGE